MRVQRNFYIFVLLSLLFGISLPAYSTSSFKNSETVTSFFSIANSTNTEVNILPINTISVRNQKAYKSSFLPDFLLFLVKNSSPELHNQITFIEKTSPQNTNHKYLNFIFTLQTVK